MTEREEYSFGFLAPVQSVAAWRQLQFAAVAGGSSWDQEAVKGGLMLMGCPSGLPAVGGPFLLSQTQLEMPSQRCVSQVTLVKLSLRSITKLIFFLVP